MTAASMALFICELFLKSHRIWKDFVTNTNLAMVAKHFTMPGKSFFFSLTPSENSQ